MIFLFFGTFFWKFDHPAVEYGLTWDAMNLPEVCRQANASPGMSELLTTVGAITRVWVSIRHISSVA